MIWIWSLPVTSIILIVFACIWGRKPLIIGAVSLLIWVLILAIYLQFLKYNIWSLFLLGIPAQLATTLSGKIKRNKKTD